MGESYRYDGLNPKEDRRVQPIDGSVDGDEGMKVSRT